MSEYVKEWADGACEPDAEYGEVVCNCDLCDAEIYAGEVVYKIGSEVYCENCVTESRDYA